MSNVVISPNMGLPVPVVGVDPGPDWATNINSCLSTIDQHNHSSGQGVQINPNGIDINSDLPFNGNNATSLRSTRFTSQSSPLSGTADIGCLYESGVDLYYNDGNSNQIRLTQNGSVSGSSGTITGLPSGTASASYSAGTFTFQSATSTPAAMAVGPVSIGNQTANSKTITLAPNNGISNNYDITLPAALPSTLNYVTLDNSGNLSYNSSGVTGSGAVMLQTSPSMTTPTINTSATINLTSSAVPILINQTWSSSAQDFIDVRFQKSSTSIFDLGLDTTNGTTTGSSNAFYIYPFSAASPAMYITTAGAVNMPNGITFPSGTMIDYKEGTWSSTITNITNVTSVTPNGSQYYQRVGNIVTCWVYFTLVVPLYGQASQFNINLPISPNNNFSTSSQAMGIITLAGNNGSGYGVANISAKTVGFFFASEISSINGVLNFRYIIND